MKKIIMIILALSFALVASDEYGVSINVGKSGSIESYRVGLQKNFNKILYSNETISLNGFHELGIGTLRGHNGDHIDLISYSPVFTLNFNRFNSSTIKPYIDGAIGVSAISRKTINSKDLSSTFQFEDRVSLGLSLDNINLYIRLIHYSNGGIKEPNDGINIVNLGIDYKF